MLNPDESNPAAAELDKALLPVAAAAGLPDAATTSHVPEINVRMPPLRIARDLGALLRDKGLFTLMSGGVVTVKADGTFEPMTTNRLRTWAAAHVSFVEWVKDEPRPSSLTKDAAAVVLEADAFKAQLPVIERVRSVCLPAPDGNGGVRLLPAGYDAKTRVWTLDDLDYARDMKLPAAHKVLDELLSGYPWGDAADWCVSRYASCHVAAMLTPFCEMLLEGALVPMFLWNANKKGSGKTMLAKTPLMVVHGDVDQTDYPSKPEAMTDLLDAAVLTANPYLFFDDIETDEMKSHALNAFVTSLRRSGRIKGVSRTFSAKNSTRVFCTGNTKSLDGELGRRTIVIDLFCALDPTKRKHAVTIDERYILSRRADILAALWACVREWFQHGAKPNETRRPTFERFSEIIGGIVTMLLLPDPIPISAAARDERAAALEAGIVALADRVADVGRGSITVDDLRAQLETHGTLEAVVPYAKNEKGERVKLGLMLKHWKGSEMLTNEGRRFSFGRREQSDRTNYDIVFLDPCDLNAARFI